MMALTHTQLQVELFGLRIYQGFRPINKALLICLASSGSSRWSISYASLSVTCNSCRGCWWHFSSLKSSQSHAPSPSMPPSPPSPKPSSPMPDLVSHLERGASCHHSMRGTAGELFSERAVMHVMHELPRAIGYSGRVFARAAERMRASDIDGDLKWSAMELHGLLSDCCRTAVPDAKVRDRVLHDTLRGCVVWS